jgi:hypothetical protein
MPPLIQRPLFITIFVAIARASQDNNFCGTTWADASSSCQDRQHCPSGSDDECTITPGQICFADTLCDASKGDGAKAALAGLAYLIDIPEEDIRNRKFCGSWWAAAQEVCSVDTFCGHDEGSCQEFTTCYETGCNVQELVAAEMGEDWKELLSGSPDDNDDDSEAGKPKIELDEKDARRSNFCGSTWADASAQCGTWCLGEDTDCPGNLKCFGDTTCWYDADLMPSLSPTLSPPSPPPSRSPIGSGDPINNREFLGLLFLISAVFCPLMLSHIKNYRTLDSTYRIDTLNVIRILWVVMGQCY